MGSSTPAIIGLLYPGDMGASLARVLVAHGFHVVTSLEGRSERTRGLAQGAGVEVLQSDKELLQTASVVLCVCWPSKAIEVAQRIAAVAASCQHLRTTVYADLNAISPASALAVADALRPTSIDVVDGGIIGGPARLQDGKLEYCPVIALSGPKADELRSVLGPAFGEKVKTVSNRIGAASGLKLAYASMTKGFLALATNALSLASATDTLDALAEEVQASQPDFWRLIEARLAVNMAKSPRWIGEMDEIAAAMRDVGIDGGSRMFDGAARTWEHVETTPLGREPIETAKERRRTWREAVAAVAPPAPSSAS